MVPANLAKWALLHEADEPLIGDWIAMIKDMPEAAFVGVIAGQIMQLTAKKYKLEWPIPDEFFIWDKRICSTEMLELMPRTKEVDEHCLRYPPIENLKLRLFSPSGAAEVFYCQYRNLFQ